MSEGSVAGTYCHLCWDGMDARRSQITNEGAQSQLKKCAIDSVARVIEARQREAVNHIGTVDYDLGEDRNNDLGDHESDQEGCETDAATVPIMQIPVEVKMLYAGPSALEATLYRKREELRQGIAQHCDNKINPEIVVAQPPFDPLSLIHI